MAQLCTIQSICAPPGPLGDCSVWVGPTYPVVICCSLLEKINLDYELMGNGLSTCGRIASKLLKFLQKMEQFG